MKARLRLEWPAFFGLILLAWGAVWAMQPAADAAALARIYGNGFWAALCAPLTADSAYWRVWVMWALMVAAMMAPSFVPTLAAYRDLDAAQEEAGRGGGAQGFAALLGGYLVVWMGFSAAAALAQLGLARAGLLDGAGASASWWLSAALFTVAGAYQFSALKQACLSKCRAPLAWFIGNWREGRAGAAVMGLRLGAICLGCCWALMALGFVGGVMNPVWMGLATLLMVLEKLPAVGRWLSAPLGIAALSAAVYAALSAAMI